MDKERRIDWLLGLAIFGSAIAGIAGLIIAMVAVVFGRMEAVGSCLVASAVAFGALANALLRS